MGVILRWRPAFLITARENGRIKKVYSRVPISPSHPSNGCNVTKQEAEHRGQGILHRRDRNLLGHDVPGSLVDPAERCRRAGRIAGCGPQGLGKAGQTAR